MLVSTASGEAPANQLRSSTSLAMRKELRPSALISEAAFSTSAIRRELETTYGARIRREPASDGVTHPGRYSAGHHGHPASQIEQ